jgi:hypothetical protein
LFFLLAPLQIVLLFSGKGSAKTREYTTQRRNYTTVSLGRERPGLGWGSVRDANLGNKEWFTGVSYTPDELAQRLKVGILQLLHPKIGGEEVCFVPVVHLEASERPLDLSLRIKIHPPHAVRHDHLANLGSRRFGTALATKGQTAANRSE